MTGRENFRRAVLREKPHHVPVNGGYSAHAKYDEASECKVVNCPLGNADWGYAFTRLDDDAKTMGQVTEHPLKTREAVFNWKPPDLKGINRFAGMAESVEAYKKADLFVFGGIGSFVFERMHWLVSMEALFEMMLLDPEPFLALGEKIVDFNCELICEYADIGVDGIWGGDDWGLQDRLMISPSMWRTFFRPWYARLFKTAKEKGLVTYMHSCGKNNDIILDLAECGLDAIELHQPNVYDVDWLSKNAGGKISFSATPDIQRTLPFGDKDKIIGEIAGLKDKLGCFDGGLMYIFYPNPEAIDIPFENMDLYLEKAREIGRY